MSASRSSSTAAPVNDIRGVLIQVAGARLLLPNATIAEVLSYATPEPVADAPDWLLGRIRWHGWRVPLVAFSTLAGIGDEQPGLGSKVLVLKASGSGETGTGRVPYFAIVSQGFPRLITVSRAGLGLDDTRDDLSDGVRARVLHNDDPALLPDLVFIEARIAEAVAAQAA